MICPGCKCETRDGSIFCENCGCKIDTVKGFEQQLEQPVMDGQTVFTGNGLTGEQQENGGYTAPLSMQAPQETNKKNTTLIFGIVGGVVAIALVAVLLFTIWSNRTARINLNDYVEVEFSGYDGMGTAQVDFDYDALYADVKAKAKIKSSEKAAKDWEELLDEGEAGATAYFICMHPKCELDKSTELTNGDTVTVSYDFDNEELKEFKIEFTGEEKTFSVSGLEEVQEYDPFQNVTVQFTGTSPNAYAEVKLTDEAGEIEKEISYTLDKYNELAVGDTVTVTAKVWDEDYILEEYGYILGSTTKKFTCEGVDQYILKADDLDEEAVDAMKETCKDTIEAYFAQNKEYISGSKITYEGYYFLTRKDQDSWYDYNKVYMVYSVQVKSKDKSFKKKTVYMPMEFSDIIKYTDGTMNISTSTSIEGSTSLSFDWFSSVSGYLKKRDMESDLVTANKGEYTCETVGKGLK